jgi:BirA family biotin operon repressor/biotin-[acetyl-CoA-carboxylase] ligase
MSPSELSPERIAQLLRTQRYGRSLRVVASTASTNDDARSDALERVADGHVVVADTQTQGRGSHGRAWSSPAGKDLYVSIVARPEVRLAALPKLTLAVGLGVADAVDAVLGAPRARVKWPNDVWLERKKVSGILVEASSIGDEANLVVIGIGLNVNRIELEPEIAESASSLRLASGASADLDRAAVLCGLLLAVEASVDRFVAHGPEAIVAEVDRRLALRGERVEHEGLEGILLGLSTDGAVRIETRDGVVERFAGRLLPLD